MDEGGGGRGERATRENEKFDIDENRVDFFFFNRANGIALIERDLKRWGGNEKVAITR